MPGSPKERRARPALAERLSLAAQPPAPIPLPATPSLGMSRSLGYPTDAEVRQGRGEERQAARQAAADRHAREGRSHAAPEQAPHRPLGLSLPPEVERGLAEARGASQKPPPKGPGWAGLDAPFSTLPPLAQIATTLVQEAVAAHGESAMTVGVAYKARRVAHVLLHGTEMPWQEGRG